MAKQFLDIKDYEKWLAEEKAKKTKSAAATKAKGK